MFSRRLNILLAVSILVAAMLLLANQSTATAGSRPTYQQSLANVRNACAGQTYRHPNRRCIFARIRHQRLYPNVRPRPVRRNIR